jgi:hypothetical protein
MADEWPSQIGYVFPDDAVREFLSEKELGLGHSPSKSEGKVTRAHGAPILKGPAIDGGAGFAPYDPHLVQPVPHEISDVEIIYLDDRGASEFLPEAALAMSSQLTVRRSAKVQHRTTVVRTWSAGRTWRASAPGRAVQVALGAAALTAILAMYAIGTSTVVVHLPNDRPTAGIIDQSVSPRAPTRGSSLSAIPFAAQSERSPGESADGRLHHTSSVPAHPSSLPLSDAEGSSHAPALAVSRSTVPIGVNAPVRVALEGKDEAVSQMVGSADTGQAVGEPNRSAELPNPLRTRPGQAAAFTVAIPATSGSAVRAAESSAIVPADDGEDDLRPVPSAAAESVGTALTSSIDTALVRDLLVGYRAAYERLDARLAKQVWPGVDEGALARAFDGLESQTVTFETCNLTVSDARAVASCRGTATYVTRLGRRSSRTESRQWTFLLEKSAERWVIGAVQIR